MGFVGDGVKVLDTLGVAVGLYVVDGVRVVGEELPPSLHKIIGKTAGRVSQSVFMLVGVGVGALS